jgi:hypothetical protein
MERLDMYFPFPDRQWLGGENRVAEAADDGPVRPAVRAAGSLGGL